MQNSVPSVAAPPDASEAPVTLDVTGLNCPLPFFKLRRFLRAQPPGVRVEVLSTDPLAPGDFAELCDSLRHRLVETRHEGAVARTVIVVGPAKA